MTEDEARRVLLLRAFEDPPAAPWSAEQRDAVSDEARRRLGESSSLHDVLVTRADLGLQRLLALQPGARSALAASRGAAGWAPVVLGLAFALGLTLDGATGGTRINLFAPPLIAMLAWNLIVYAVIGLNAVRSPLAPGLRAWLSQRVVRHFTGPVTIPARFASDWLQASLPLQSQRIAALLHASAALLASGMVVSMYARGSFFEFRAGWDSTFFDAATLHRAMILFFAPAAALSGVPLPGVNEFAALRFSVGNGEVAARWIHLLAITVGLVVVLPRAVLWAVARVRAGRLARHFPLPLDDAYFRALRLPSGALSTVVVLPYAHRLDLELADGLRRSLVAEIGARVALSLAEPVAMGDEDAVAHRLVPGIDPAACVALLALTATPERETHGRFLQILAAQPAAARRLIVLLDETSFRQRFGDGQRLAQRRSAWRDFLAERDHEPLFADLSSAKAER
jgi:hypothetical protein